MALNWTWIGPGLCRILFNLDWIRPVTCFINSGSGMDLDWVNGKNCVIFVIKKVFLLNFCTLFGWDFSFQKMFGLWFYLDWVLKIQDWIEIAKYDITDANKKLPTVCQPSSVHGTSDYYKVDGNSIFFIIIVTQSVRLYSAYAFAGQSIVQTIQRCVIIGYFALCKLVDGIFSQFFFFAG